MADYLSTVFVSPKRGGILQSSGLLDLKSLMALNRTCKANMIDEQSLILLIENEITRYHGVKTMEEAIEFWRNICRSKPLLKPWLKRDRSAAKSSIKVTRYLLSDASRYEVMLVKMLRTVPTQSERMQIVSEQGALGRTPLHNAAISGNPESIKTMLALYPDSERLKDVRDFNGWTVLHCAAQSGNPASIRLILALYPERERLRVVTVRDCNERNTLHWVAWSGDPDCIKLILSHYPESERLRAVSMPDNDEWTVLHCAAQSGKFESIETILALYPESDRLQALNSKSQYGETVLHLVADSNNIECIKDVLSLYPESEHWKLVNVQDEDGETVLDFMKKETRDSVMEWLSKDQ